MNSAAPSKKPNLQTLVFFAGILFVCALAVSNQSFWIDEASTALKAQQTTLPNWWHEMRRAGGSDLQMPLYMIWIWVCEKFFGSSEIALRAVNLFWILPGLVALWVALARQPRLQLAIFLAAVFNPFLWYYLDEARPYAMQIGASLFLAAIALLVVLAFYYLWTLKAGARASDVASTDWKNVAFIGYELLGFAGLGPGRLEIRDGGLDVFKPYASELGLFAALVLAVIFFAVRDLLQNYPRKKLLGLVVIVAVPAIFILATGFVLHFRVLGRHFAPLLAIVVFLLGVGVSAAWRGAAGKILVVGFFTFCIASGLSLKFATRHAKDDYRSAAGLARTALADGKSVWWNADANAAAYYKLPLATNPIESGRAFLMINPPSDFLATNVPADVVIVSRPDIYDPHGTLAIFLARNDFKKAAVLPAFVVWEKAEAN